MRKGLVECEDGREGIVRLSILERQQLLAAAATFALALTFATKFLCGVRGWSFLLTEQLLAHSLPKGKVTRLCQGQSTRVFRSPD